MNTKGKAGVFEKALGKILKNMRVALGYNQEDIAKEIGVTFQQVQKYEGGTNRISLYNFLKICNFFNISFSDIIEKVEQEEETVQLGFAEETQASFKSDYFSRPETGNFLRELYKIHNPEKRKQVLDIIKTFQKDN